MDIMYEDTISAHIHGEEWTIIMILEIVDCLNGLCENDFTYDENMYLSISNILNYFILSTILS